MIRLFKSALVCGFLGAVLSISGVVAAWIYTTNHLASVDASLPSNVPVWEYKPEDIVPDDEEASKAGENHLSLIDIILNHVSYGLNATHKPIIHNYLKKPGDIIYCDQKVSGGNLKHLLVEYTYKSEKLYFVMTKISDTEYHCYTMRYSDIGTYPIGTEIEVYKTKMVRGEDGKWTAPVSYYGYAKVCDPGTVSRAIDITTWRNHQ